MIRGMKKYLASLLALLGIHQHLSAEQRQDLIGAAMHTTPGVAAGGVFKIAGLPLSDWLVIASLLFLGLQAAYLVWKWRRDYRRDQQQQSDRQRLAAMARPAADPDTDMGAL